MAAMIPELGRIFEHSEAQHHGLVDMIEEARRELELLDLLRNLQLEEATGAGLDPSFFYCARQFDCDSLFDMNKEIF
ncbi:hypothetical protein AMTR_s00005p00250290 [Amborella trichopoda]|uniref:Uncharacterized protein n=1 Tax=Amborella trichopoda TaxID=13333 RepID=W1PGW4_AMBTC|nr:hypothetical protein AMTR_s00005p00250290 [Amborella trichopoda]